MNTQKNKLPYNPVQETFKDVSSIKLVISCLRAFWRIYLLQGLTGALRVIPIVWTIIVATRSFAAYQALEYERAGGGGDLEEAVLTKEEWQEYRRLGKWLRNKLHNFGPTFIKIGQTLSTRADLLPLPAMLELASLQEEAEPYSLEVAKQTIVKAFGKAPEELYASFDTKPIAAASLCQAYKATLFDGRDVVVKVQRPNLPMIISADVQILEAIADEVMRYPSLCRHTNWPGIVEEFAATTFEEIDYIREGRNADRFRHNLRNEPNIYIPRIIWRLTGRKVLTIEYVPGAKITDATTLEAMGIDKREITTAGCNFYLRQLLEDGFFHADPHPGNIRIMPDSRVGFFDFGMVGVVSAELKHNLVMAFLHLVKQQYRELVNDFIAMGFLPKDVDGDSLCRDLSPIIDARFKEGINKVRFRKMLFDFSEVVWRYPFRLPTDFTYIMRALLTLEGVALTIDPEFNFMDIAIPYAQRLLLKESGAVFRQALLKEIFVDGRFNPYAAINLFKAATKITNSPAASLDAEP